VLPAVKEMLAILGGNAFRDAVDKEPGYALYGPGTVLTLKQAFPWIR
jgi:hypothetical protein